MDKNKIFNLTYFEKAIHTLQEAVAAQLKKPSDNFIRDACIQRFEYTYELAHKTLRRYLAITEPNDELVKEMSFPDLIRLGCTRNLLLGDVRQWKRYRDARNNTSHTYNELVAIEVVNTIPAFLQEALSLQKTLAKKLGQI